jgi:hypothetical protein
MICNFRPNKAQADRTVCVRSYQAYHITSDQRVVESDSPSFCEDGRLAALAQSLSGRPGTLATHMHAP